MGPSLSSLLRLSVATILVGSASASAFAADPGMLGVIEEVRAETASGERLETSLRLGFLRTTTGWTPLCSQPSELRNAGCSLSDPARDRHWAVLFRGKRVGEVTTSGWLDSQTYASTGALKITSSSIPRVGDRSDAFAGWASSDTYRPLIAVLGLTPGTNTSWRVIKPTSADLTAVWPGLRDLVKRIPKCEEGRGLVGTSISVARKHLEVFRVLQSKNGDKLVGARALPRLAEDCYERSGFASGVWFHWPAHGKPRVVSEFRRDDWASDLEPVEVGDFDGDGRSEALFWLSEYNKNGYVLFFDEFRRTASCSWSYH